MTTQQRPSTGARGSRGPRGTGGGQGRRDARPHDRNRERGDDEFGQAILDLSRVTRVTAGGKRMRFRASVAVGDRKGHVGIGVAKGLDVSSAISKATSQAKKHLTTVPIRRETIPCDVFVKYKGAQVLLKPAPKGSGIIAGGVVRLILELSGVTNVAAKMLGSSNKVANAQATMRAIDELTTIVANRAPRA